MKCGFSPFVPQNRDVANQVMMCHRVPRFRVKYEKTTIFQGKMDFRKTPVGDAFEILWFADSDLEFENTGHRRVGVITLERGDLNTFFSLKLLPSRSI